MKNTPPALPTFSEIASLTLPQMGLMLCHLAMSLTDMWVVGRLDNATLAALGMVSQIFGLLMLLTSIVGSGCMAVVSQSLGAGRVLRARRYAGLILGLSFTVGSGIALLGLLTLPLLLTVLAPGSVVQAASLHQGLSQDLHQALRIFALASLCQLPFYYCLIMMNSLFRAHKMVWLPFATLCVMAAANLAGSAGLGLGLWGLPHLGYVGVAAATLGSTVLGAGLNLALITGKGILCRQSFASWRWNKVAYVRLLRIGGPATLGHLAVQIGGLALLSCLAALPQGAVAAVAGMTLGLRVQGILLFPTAALGMTLTILTGHMLGARHKAQVYAFGKQAAVWTGLIMAVCALGLYLCRRMVAEFFSLDAVVVQQAEQYLLFACIGLPLQNAAQMLHAVFAGAGATRLPCLASCAGLWLVGIPLAYALGHGLQWGATGVYTGMVCGHIVMALWTFRMYRQREWLPTYPKDWSKACARARKTPFPCA